MTLTYWSKYSQILLQLRQFCQPQSLKLLYSLKVKKRFLEHFRCNLLSSFTKLYAHLFNRTYFLLAIFYFRGQNPSFYYLVFIQGSWTYLVFHSIWYPVVNNLSQSSIVQVFQARTIKARHSLWNCLIYLVETFSQWRFILVLHTKF